MSARLATSILVGGLVRKAESEGGFAALLAKGDPTAGSLIVLLAERGAIRSVLERILQSDGSYKWLAAGSHTEETVKNLDVPAFVARRRRFDPDLWVLELDIPSAERFAAEMNSAG